MSLLKAFLIIFIVVVFALATLFYNLFYGVWSNYPLDEKGFLAQLYFGTITIIGIVGTLLYATGQFVRAIAKPRIKVYLNKEKAESIPIDITEKVYERYKIPLYAYNEGNAVADLYQIEIEFLPGCINLLNPSYLVRAVEGDRINLETSAKTKRGTISFYSQRKDEYICFIGKFVKIGDICFKPPKEKLDEMLEDTEITYQVKYRVFGSWAEKYQEKHLWINLIKMEGV